MYRRYIFPCFRGNRLFKFIATEARNGKQILKPFTFFAIGLTINIVIRSPRPLPLCVPPSFSSPSKTLAQFYF